MRPDNTRPLRIFIGYDHSEESAYHVLCHSILSRSSIPLSFTPVKLSHLTALHHRERNPLQSTDFSFTRWLTPYLANYSSDLALFMDCDMLVMKDIAGVLNYITEYRPVHCVKHNYKPVAKTKMQGAIQTQYDKKNWSSFMMFWPAHSDCRRLTPQYVDEVSGLDLHQFKWVRDRVGSIGYEWNHLVGHDDPLAVEQGNVSCIHWTEGGPWWKEYEGTPHAHLWFEEREAMLSSGGYRHEQTA